MPSDCYGYRLTTGDAAATAYNRGLLDVLRLRSGALEHFATSIVLDPTFAMGHAALALLGHEMCAPVDVDARLRQARAHAGRATERERSHINAIAQHMTGNPRPLIDHLAAFPRDALLLSTAVPTIAFAGATEVPEEAWAIVERAVPAYGDDWWFQGLLAFIRQAQHRFDEAMSLACASLAVEPGAGHSAHARAHAHYETGDHAGGLAWMSQWVLGDGSLIDSLSHFSWHAALHELSLGDLDAVRRRYTTQLQPGHALGCRALVDSGSLLFRWALTPGATDVPDITEVVRVTGRETLARPATPFLAMHAAVTHLATGDVEALDSLRTWAAG
ncbi:MAG: pyridine nucleotide-disulfide oxidoreductase, partial [Nocardioides sp.]|nr:pyridine nucleotide-disulfide oxidoreductase [Nocardioides sp.]